jgi:hypothetical protein
MGWRIINKDTVHRTQRPSITRPSSFHNHTVVSVSVKANRRSIRRLYIPPSLFASAFCPLVLKFRQERHLIVSYRPAPIPVTYIDVYLKDIKFGHENFYRVKEKKNHPSVQSRNLNGGKKKKHWADAAWNTIAIVGEGSRSDCIRTRVDFSPSR